MSSTIPTLAIVSMAIDGPRTRMVRYGQDFSAAGRGGGVPGGSARRLRRPWTARSPVAGDAGSLPDRRPIPHVPRTRSDSGVGDYGTDERLADSNRRLVLCGRHRLLLRKLVPARGHRRHDPRRGYAYRRLPVPRRLGVPRLRGDMSP